MFRNQIGEGLCADSPVVGSRLVEHGQLEQGRMQQAQLERMLIRAWAAGAALTEIVRELVEEKLPSLDLEREVLRAFDAGCLGVSIPLEPRLQEALDKHPGWRDQAVGILQAKVEHLPFLSVLKGSRMLLVVVKRDIALKVLGEASGHTHMPTWDVSFVTPPKPDPAASTISDVSDISHISDVSARPEPGLGDHHNVHDGCDDQISSFVVLGEGKVFRKAIGQAPAEAGLVGRLRKKIAQQSHEVFLLALAALGDRELPGIYVDIRAAVMNGFTAAVIFEDKHLLLLGTRYKELLGLRAQALGPHLPEGCSVVMLHNQIIVGVGMRAGLDGSHLPKGAHGISLASRMAVAAFRRQHIPALTEPWRILNKKRSFEKAVTRYAQVALHLASVQDIKATLCLALSQGYKGYMLLRSSFGLLFGPGHPVFEHLMTSLNAVLVRQNILPVSSMPLMSWKVDFAGNLVLALELALDGGRLAVSTANAVSLDFNEIDS